MAIRPRGGVTIAIVPYDDDIIHYFKYNLAKEGNTCN